MFLYRRRAILAGLFALAFASALPAQPKKDEDPLSFDRSIRSIVQNLCYRCHNNDKQKGDVNLAQDENPRLIAQNRKVWLTALEAVEMGEMPPKKEKQPTAEQKKLLLEFLRQTLSGLDCEQTREPGKPSVRRLNRTEYNNSIRQLTGLDLSPADSFPPDATGYGFDNIGEVLTLSPVQVEQYHQAARKILAELLAQKAARPQAYAEVFYVQPGKGLSDRDAAKLVIERFAMRAFRRPAESIFIDRLMGLYDRARTEKKDHETSVLPMLTAVLISPRFLMRIESARPGTDGPYPVDDYDLATRLSYFLWSGPPDDVLLDLASRGELGKPDTLEAQTRRLLADPRSHALVENFFGQWLQLRGLDTHKPDAAQFPQFNEPLRAAMKQEINLFLGEIIRQDRPLTHLIDADYTYANADLARHYGLPEVHGNEMRRIRLPDRRRGGILTTAAVLMLQSDPDRTNVPRRGNYVAGSILGAPPPPPPPVVPALEESKSDGKQQTLREILEIHRQNPECASCHAKIDPLGFGLQNFDAIGQWRDQEAGKPIDASGELPGGKTFNGPVELKDILLQRQDAFARTLAENMLVYALGRGLQHYDECVTADALKAAQQNEYRFSSVVLAIVRSYPFRHRKNPDF